MSIMRQGNYDSPKIDLCQEIGSRRKYQTNLCSTAKEMHINTFPLMHLYEYRQLSVKYTYTH